MHFFASLLYELQLIIAASTGQSYPSKCTPALARPPQQSRSVRQSVSTHRRHPPRTKRMSDSTDSGEAEKRLVVESGQPSGPDEPLADGELQRPHGPVPQFNYAPATSQPCHDAASSCSSSSSLDDFEIPPTPKLRTRDLPDSPSIVISPLPPLPPPSSHPVDPARAAAGAPDFDPFYDDPLLRPLAEDWSSLDRGTSLSLVQEPSDDDWPYSNALGLYVDPSINVSAWDCGGFIRSTAPSPSPTWVARNRRRI